MPALRECVIVNPNAGSAEEIAAIEARLAQDPAREIVRTTGPGEAVVLARRAAQEGFDRVVAAGGDGTLNEVLNGIADHLDRVELALLPVGTGNDFARSVGIPADAEKALAILELGRVLPVDVVRLRSADTRLLLNASAGGFSAVVSEKMDSRSKDWWGALAYSWTALKSIPDIEEYQLTLTVDGRTEEISAYNLVVANAKRIAGGIPIAPQAEIDDGQLDVLVVPAMPLARFTLLLPRILLGTHLDSEDLVIRRGAVVDVRSEPAVLLNADGEVTATSPASFEVLHRKLRFVVGELASNL